MKILTHLKQSSEEWLQARAGKITASRAKNARDRLKNGKASAKQVAYAAQVAIERIAGRPLDKLFQSWQMKEGQAEEPLARVAYEAMTGYLVEEVGAIATEDDQFLYSPDGLIDDDGLLEIKSLFSPERILQIIADEDHSDFIDQCMFGLWLTGRQWIDLAIWCPALAPIGLHLTVRRITRDEVAIEALEDDLLAFATLVRENEAKLRQLAAEKLPKVDGLEIMELTFEVPLAPAMPEVVEVVQIESFEPAVAEPLLLPDMAREECAEISAAPMMERATAQAPTPPDTGETLRLGQITERLGFNLPADFLRQLGFEPVAIDKSAKLYRVADFDSICAALILHISDVRMLQAA